MKREQKYKFLRRDNNIPSLVGAGAGGRTCALIEGAAEAKIRAIIDITKS